MPTYIVQPGRINVPGFQISFSLITHPGIGWVFDCSPDGVVDAEKLPPAARENLRLCMLGGGAGGYAVGPGELRDFSHSYWESGSIRCQCWREHHLSRGDSRCECGQDYNAGGQRLNPPHMWDDIDYGP